MTTINLYHATFKDSKAAIDATIAEWAAKSYGFTRIQSPRKTGQSGMCAYEASVTFSKMEDAE